MFSLIFMMIIIAVGADESNSTNNYDPAELLSKLFRLDGQETHQRNVIADNFDSERSEIDPREKFEDLLPNADFRNEFKRKKKRRLPRQRFPIPGFNGQPYPYPGHGHFYEQPSFATEALSQVIEALTSIATYDDYQCVPRLLCEAAGGGALGSSNLLQSVVGLQPLLSLLSAYSGVSSNPLFVFGRAVLLGVSSKESVGSCRYAYPLCPTDPEQLVFYLNNHNGGFFRFFNSPQKGQQNVEQFYNHLQGYGFQQNHSPHIALQQNHNQNYGFYQPENGVQSGIKFPFQNDNGLCDGGIHGLSSYGLQKPNSHLDYQGGYGFAYPHNKFKYNKIQKRIQNKPTEIENGEYSSNHLNLKWTFPDSNKIFGEEAEIFNDNRKRKALKFPDVYTKISESHEDSGFVFPNNNRQYYPNYIDNNAIIFKGEAYNDNNNLNNNYNSHFKSQYQNNPNNNYKSENGFVTVYVVRGNGDPNKPEIIKLRPGDTV